MKIIKKPSLMLILFMGIYACSKNPVKTGEAIQPVDITRDPIQYTMETDSSVTISMKGGEFTLAFLAEYSLSGIVVCKQRYSRGWAAKIAPYDLTFCWGKIPEDYVRKHISFSHSGRWYHYKYSDECPVNNQYIIRHTSNNHIIPATENVRLAIASIKRNTPVLLWGYLVNIRGTYKDDPCWWYTSRTRKDTGAHSCEVFYVITVQIGKDLYE